MADKLNESLTGVSFTTLNDDFMDMLSDWDVSTKSVAQKMSEYMRKALIQEMFKAQYKKQLQNWYKMWAKALIPEGEGGSKITKTRAKTRLIPCAIPSLKARSMPPTR